MGTKDHDDTMLVANTAFYYSNASEGSEVNAIVKGEYFGCFEYLRTAANYGKYTVVV